MSASEPGTAPRELIAASARTLFESNGYAATSVRRIAGAAGVDPSLVIRHFGSKELLFIQVIGLDGYVAPPVSGPIESLGERLAAFVLAPEQAEFRTRLAVLVRASDRATVRKGLRSTVRRIFVDQIAEVLRGDDREVRAQLIATQLGGIVQASAAIEEEVLTKVSRQRLVELYGRAIQTLVDPM